MKTKHIVLLLSGGLDSVVLLYYLLQLKLKVHCALFNYKQRHVQELEWAKHHCHRMNVLFTTFDLPQLRGSELTDGSGGVIVPNRNAILISHAVNLGILAGADEVVFAANADDNEVFPDCRREFVDAYNAMLKAAGIQIVIAAPFLNRSKGWIASLGHGLGVKFNETWSCYRGGLQPCGECGACLKRAEALK